MDTLLRLNFWQEFHSEFLKPKSSWRIPLPSAFKAFCKKQMAAECAWIRSEFQSEFQSEKQLGFTYLLKYFLANEYIFRCESYTCHLLTFPIGFYSKKIGYFLGQNSYCTTYLATYMYFEFCNFSKDVFYSEGTDAFVIAPNI